MSFIQDWREEIHHARVHKPEWRPYILILDALKGLATLGLVSAYVYGVWYMLYGVPDQYESAAPTVQVVSSLSGSKPVAKTGIRTDNLEQPLVLRALVSAPSVMPLRGLQPGSTDTPASTAVEKSISRSKEVMRAKKVPQPTAAVEADNT